MKKLLLILLFLPIIGLGQSLYDCDSLSTLTLMSPGVFSINSINESDNIRNGPDYSGATIYFPINANGPLRSIVLVPGFMNLESTIQNWGSYLASHGIVTMTIGSNNLTDNPTQRSAALLDAIITLKAEQYRIESPLYNLLDTNNFAVGGFSMGGGGAQLAAVSDSTIKAVIALYPYLLNSDSETLNHSSPTLIISGEWDPIAIPSIHANTHYLVMPDSTPKQRYEIQYANHDAISGPNGGNGEVGARVLGWLKTFLLDNHCYCSTLLNIPTTASEFTHNIICDSLFVHGCTDASAFNYDPLANVDDDSCIPFIYGCTDESACNYSSLFNTDDASCEYLNGICETCEDGIIVENDSDDDGVCDGDEVAGCQDMAACNYDALATDAGSCTYTDGICESCEDGLIVDNDSDNDGICDDEIQTYNCINAACIDPGNNTGTYTSLAACEGECENIEASWKCIEGSCLELSDGSGLYSALADCEVECHTSSITDPNKANKKLKKITNLVGQEIPIRKNTTMFYIYDDGTVEKKFIIE